MRLYNILDLKLQELHVFTAAAEYQSITKAAEYLSVTPSQVSKTIKKLEEQWGVQLFIREKNQIRLTPAGRHAYSRLGDVMQNVENVLDEAVSIQKVTPFIRVGCPTLSEPNELIVPIVKRFLKIYPEASVTIECADTLGELRKKLIDGSVDIIFTADYEVEENRSVIEWHKFETCPLYLVLNEAHPLTQKDDIDWPDIIYEEFVLLNPYSSMNTSRIINICEKKGFTPCVAHYTPNIYSQLMAVHIDPKVVCLLALRYIKPEDGLVYKKLPDTYCFMGFAYKRDAHKLVKDFAKCAMQLTDA